MRTPDTTAQDSTIPDTTNSLATDPTAAAPPRDATADPARRRGFAGSDSVVVLRRENLQLLLTSVLPFTGGGTGALGAVRLRSAPGGWLTAAASDRTRIAMCRVRATRIGPGFDVLLRRVDAQRVLGMFPSHLDLDDDDLAASDDVMRPALRIDPGGHWLTAGDASNVHGATYSCALIHTRVLGPSLTWPRVDQALRQALAQPATFTQLIDFDTRTFADLAAARMLHDEPMRAWTSGPGKTIAIAIGTHLVGCALPHRRRQPTNTATHDADSWAPLLG
jgi:hypothetical protein